MHNTSMKTIIAITLLAAIGLVGSMDTVTTSLNEAVPTVAARYHLRSRSSNFYNRASRSSSRSSVVLFKSRR